MAGAAVVVVGIALTSAATLGALALWDPLKPAPASDEPIAQWTDGVIPTTEAAMGALAALGYGGDQAVSAFQEDVNHVREWATAMAAGEERIPPVDSEFTQVPAALTVIPAGAPLVVNNELDEPTAVALADALASVRHAAMRDCVDPSTGEAIEPDFEACQGQWAQAVQYAYYANANAAPEGEGEPPTMVTATLHPSVAGGGSQGMGPIHTNPLGRQTGGFRFSPWR